MRSSIWACLCVLMFLSTFLAEEGATHLTYFVEYEVEQEDDYIEVALKIESQSRSLVEALANAKKTASQVALLANNHCKENAKKGKGDCKDAVQISSYEIDPKYQLVRKESTFSTFVVSHDITISVFSPESIGYLIDSFLKYPDLTIESFEWLPLEETDPEQSAIKEGLEQGQGLCEQINLTLGKVLSVEQIIEQQEGAPAEEEEQEEAQEEEQAEIIKYKFEVQCVAKKAKAK